MSTGGTGGTGTTPTTHGGLRGVPPTIFDGNRANADDFWSEFRRYKLNNRAHPAITVPFDRVLTALSYIRGPLVNDWVNSQEEHLTTRTDTTVTPHVLETDEVLWTEFTTAFQNSWKDSSKKQNAHDQLRKLVMKGWDIDTYIVTFERLALSANWALAAEGTIVQFREGLNKMVHSRALDRDKIPETFEEWKAAARTEVARAKEKYNMGLIGPRQRSDNNQQRSREFGNSPNSQTQPRTTHQPSPPIVHMEVDATNPNFKRLTPEERIQLAKEGRCFRCRLQGHMARDCPKNTNSRPSTNVREATVADSPNSSTTAPPTSLVTPSPLPPSTTLTLEQQIRALEAQMDDEQRSVYLDARDMGEDFWSAGA